MSGANCVGVEVVCNRSRCSVHDSSKHRQAAKAVKLLCLCISQKQMQDHLCAKLLQAIWVVIVFLFGMIPLHHCLAAHGGSPQVLACQKRQL